MKDVVDEPGNTETTRRRGGVEERSSVEGRCQLGLLVIFSVDNGFTGGRGGNGKCRNSARIMNAETSVRRRCVP